LKKLFIVLSLFLLVGVLAACKKTTTTTTQTTTNATTTQTQQTTTTTAQATAPTITGEETIKIKRNEDFNPLDYVTAKDAIDGNITDKIEVKENTVKKDTLGEYKVVYKVTNSKGLTTEFTATVIVDAHAPVIKGASFKQILVGGTFNKMEGVTVEDDLDGNLTDELEVTGDVDTSTEGEYTVTYKVTNSNGKVSIVNRKVRVVTELKNLANYYEGEYENGISFRYASTELRNTFFAAAEKYLLDTMYGGVPVFANAGFNLYSARVQLPVEEYVPVMGFGTLFGTMSMDDSTVVMDNNSLGEVGKYTFRSALAQNPTTFNQWIYDDSTSSDVITLFLDAPYVYKFNEAKTGYALVPSMAASLPQPVGGRTTDTGIVLSNKWRMTIREGLEWAYHKDTDTSKLPAGHEKIDANDFYNTYKLALEKKWFRAISGGGDFLAKSQAIKGAKDFVDGKITDFNQVGIKKIDDYTIEFEFVDEQAEWNVRYWLGSFVMGPINIELYNIVKDEYGTSPEKTAYNGVFKMDYYQPDSIIRYSKNEKFHDKDEYFYTGYTYRIIEDADSRFLEFINGKLDVASLPTSKYEQFKNFPGLKRVPGTTTFRLMINGTGSVDGQKAVFEDSTYVPVPLLANLNFKKAMYYVIDRKYLAEDVLKTSQAQMYHFTDAYLVDAAGGVPFRNTPEGIAVGEDFSPDTHGYNADAAAAYWRLAIDELVAQGVYKNGDTIEIELRIFSGSEAQELFGNYIKETFENTFKDTQRNIKVQINVVPTAFPNIYYDFMMVGEFDLAIGGISGSTLDAASFLEVYNSDNRGGFTLNWGIDTSQPEIEVTYKLTPESDPITELWSFDAIVSALNGTVKVKDGMEYRD